MWLAPFTPGRRHRVAIQLPGGCRPSRLKVWNYNAYRPHTQRGAREAQVRLGGRLLFTGELQQAGGAIAGADAHATTLTFTHDPQVGFPREAEPTHHPSPVKGCWRQGAASCSHPAISDGNPAALSPVRPAAREARCGCPPRKKRPSSRRLREPRAQARPSALAARRVTAALHRRHTIDACHLRRPATPAPATAPECTIALPSPALMSGKTLHPGVFR